MITSMSISSYYGTSRICYHCEKRVERSMRITGVIKCSYVGDVDLIHSPVKTRSYWPMGRVVKLLTGSDNKTRCVRLRRSYSTEEVYSVYHLYPLELSLMTNGARDEVRNVPSTPCCY